MNTEVISSRIREQRKTKRMTQADLADILGISEMTVRRWESNKSSPRIEELKLISKALGTTVDYLMGLDMPKQEEHTDDTSPTMSYWGGVLDNAKKAAHEGQNLPLIWAMLNDAAGIVKAAIV